MKMKNILNSSKLVNKYRNDILIATDNHIENTNVQNLCKAKKLHDNLLLDY